MFLIVGLGNPGKEYALTRHNIGRIVMDMIIAKLGLEVQRSMDKTSNGLIGKTTIIVDESTSKIRGKTLPYGSYQLMRVKPQTFMNHSGSCVQTLMSYYKINNKQLLILTDDLDQPFGSHKYKKKGSSGGQNGIKDIINRLNTDEFFRIKIGIGRPTQPGYQTVDRVLSTFSLSELDQLKNAISQFIHEIGLFLQGKT
ncbi:MAG TPA: aminoacyl-tRNA hydrolase [Candidatus Absconditabacterales bacterium]|nr:aminoacyl-tRNA hydrolase [Candidatus Absconditabacterales bacterium]HNG97339.1 aminoacyl-tRNA hydrolase [Candidatus Absconditabacterales bacterium]